VLQLREAKRRRSRFRVLPPARTSVLSTSNGRFGVGCEGDQCFCAVWCRLGPSISRFGCPAMVAATPWNKVLSSSSLSQWCSTPALSASSRRWCPVRRPLYLCGLPSCRLGEAAVLPARALCQPGSDSCGLCSWMDGGSSSSFPRPELKASFDTRSEVLGV